MEPWTFRSRVHGCTRDLKVPGSKVPSSTSSELQQLVARVEGRSPEGIRAHVVTQLRSNRVLDQIAQHGEQIFAIPERSIEVTRLPQQPAGLAPVEKARPLLRQADEFRHLFHITRLDEQMYMVGHDAVRKNCDIRGPGYCQKLPHNGIDGAGGDEHRATFPAANRQEMTSRSARVELGETMRMPIHIGSACSICAEMKCTRDLKVPGSRVSGCSLEPWTFRSRIHECPGT